MTMRAAPEMPAWSPGATIAPAGWLGLAVAPTCALMAWISAVGSPAMTICQAASAVAPVNDMAFMYVLMSLFHLSPWMKLLSSRSRRPTTPVTQTEGD